MYGELYLEKVLGLELGPLVGPHVAPQQEPLLEKVLGLELGLLVGPHVASQQESLLEGEVFGEASAPRGLTWAGQGCRWPRVSGVREGHETLA